MMLQLYRSPSLWSVLALCAYALNLLFHVIAYCSDQWATCTFKGRHTWFGLWQGCWTDDVTKETMCSSSVFQHPFFNTDTDWHKGAQVLMTISLIVLLFTEVVLIGYACVVKLESHKPRMIGMLVGLSISEGAFTLVSLELYRNEAQSNHLFSDVTFGYAFVCGALSVICNIAFLVCIWRDSGWTPSWQCLKHRHKNEPNNACFAVCGNPADDQDAGW